MIRFEKVNPPKGDEALAQHISTHMKLSLDEAKALMRKHGNDLKKIEAEQAKLSKA